MTEANTSASTAPKTRAKTTSRTSESAETDTNFAAFEAFSMPKMEVPAAMREATEKGIEQAREAYTKLKEASEEATDILEDTFETSRQGMIDFNLKAVDAAKTNTDATFQFARDLMGLKSFAEVIELQSSFAKGRFDALSSQTKEMQEAASKIVGDTSKPMKEAVEKAVQQFKAA